MSLISESNQRSTPSRGLTGRLRRDERGQVLAFTAAGIVMVMGFVGLAIDWGRLVLEKASISRATDGAALAAAGAIRSGEGDARDAAFSMSTSNGYQNGKDDAAVTVSFGTNSLGERIVTVTATKQVETLFLKVLGNDAVTVRSTSTAAVPPVDLVLVLDQSGSLATAGAWDDLQRAAKTFVDMFDNRMDKVGLVSFQIRAAHRVRLKKNFKGPVKREINRMRSAGDTNIDEGLRLAYDQFQTGAPRDRSVKVVVFFTDGRPTALRDAIGGRDRVIAVYGNRTGRVRGYFDNPESLPMDRVANPDGCRNYSSCYGWREQEVRDEGRNQGAAHANNIRAQNIFIYSIGLGNQALADPLMKPDMDFLRDLANEDGRVDASQPAGRAYYAPSEDELEEVFRQVAQDILVRLSQ